MYQSVFREWKVAAVFVGGICLFVGVYFAEGGGYEQLEFGRKGAPKAAPVVVAAPPARPAAPAALHFTSDEELAAAFAEPSESPSPALSQEPATVPADGTVVPPEAGAVEGAVQAEAPAAAPSAAAEQGR